MVHPLLHLAAATTLGSDWGLRLLHKAAASHGAVCLDGSPPGYYIREGLGADSNKFKIHFSPLPSAPYEPAEGTFGLLSNSSENPFANWTAVFVEYCDGTSYTGNRDMPVHVGNETIYYRGRRVLDAIIDSWLDDEGMASASQVIMSGTSAGGLATYLHAEHFRSRLPKATQLFAVPDAGFFLDLPNIHGEPAWRDSLNGGMGVWNGTGSCPQSCLGVRADHEKWQCHFPNYVLPQITSVPFFVLNSLYDTFHIGEILQLGCAPEASVRPGGDAEAACTPVQLARLQKYRDDFLAVVRGIQLKKADGGLCATGCLQHEEICRDEDFFGITLPDRATPAQMVWRWLTTRKQTIEVDVRWPNDRSCWKGDHGFC